MPPSDTSAPPPAFDGILQAIAMGFAAGFGGKSVADMQAEQRRMSWEAWQREQDAKLRREEMDRSDRRFQQQLDMQRTQLEIEQSRYEREDARRFAEDLSRGQALGMLAPVGEAEFTAAMAREGRAADEASRAEARAADQAQRDKEAADAAAFGVQEGLLPQGTTSFSPTILPALVNSAERKSAQEDRKAARYDANKAREEQMAFDIWRTLRQEDQNIEQLDSTFRQAAVSAARDDLINGRTTSFEGSVEAYMRLFGKGKAASASSSDVAKIMAQIRGGDVAAVTALQNAMPAAESRPVAESRPAAESRPVAPAAADTRPAAGTIPPVGKKPSVVLREKADSKVKAQKTAQQEERAGWVRKFLYSEVPQEVLVAIENRLGDKADEQAVIDAILSNWDAASRRANQSRSRSSAGPATIVLEAAKAAAGK